MEKQGESRRRMKGEGWKHPEKLDRCRVIKSRPLLSISFPRHSPFSSLFRLLHSVLCHFSHLLFLTASVKFCVVVRVSV